MEVLYEYLFDWCIYTFIVYVFVANYAGKRVKTTEDYYVSGRNAPTLFIIGTLVASYLSAVAFMGETGFSYDGYAIPLAIFAAISVVGYFVGANFLARYIRRAKPLTIPEYYGARFNSPAVQVTAGVITVLGLSAYLASVTQASSILMSELLGTNYGISLLIVWVIYTSLTIFAGSKGVIITDTIMFLFFAIMAFVSIPYLHKAAGEWPNSMMQAATLADKPDILSWHGLTGAANYMGTPTEILIWCITIGIVWGTVICVSPWQTSRYLMAKNEHTVIRAGLLGVLIIALIYGFFHISVVVTNVVNPNIVPVEKNFIWAALNVFPTWMGVVVLGGIMAAALSSCTTFLSLVGFSLANDILRFIGTKERSEKDRLLLSRKMMLIMSVLIALIAYFQPPAVFWITIFAATIFAASWGVPSFMSVWSKKITAKGAQWGMIAGAGVVVIVELMKTFAGVSLPVYFSSPILGAIASLIGVVIGSSLSEVTEAEKVFRENLLKTPEDEKNLLDAKEIKRTMMYPKIVMICGILMIVAMYVLYYIPYTNAVGL